MPDAARLRLYDRLARYIGMELSAEVTSSNALSTTSSDASSEEEVIEIDEPNPNKERKYQRKKCSSSDIDILFNNNNYNNNNNYSASKEKCELWLKIYAEECTSYSKALQATDHRIRLVSARAKDFSDEDFRQACKNMEQSQWIKSRGFGSFEWIVKDADNLLKLREGFYSRGKTSLPVLPLEGRPATLFSLISQAAESFGRSDIDATSLALALEDTIKGDKYYSLLADDDLKNIFDKGIKRQYQYNGLNVSGLCSWMNEYKQFFVERRRIQAMRAQN